MITRRQNNLPHKIILILVSMAIIAGCAGLEGQTKPAAVPEIRPGILAGYLDPETLPDSLVLIPPPPAEGSAARALDEEVSRKSMALRGTPRWGLAAKDAELNSMDGLALKYLHFSEDAARGRSK
jgi:acid phosphatase (class A)